MKYCVFVFLLLLTGCSVGKYEYSNEAREKVDMTFTGIPTILGAGALGTTIPLTEEYSLTAAHVARYSLYRVKSEHPECDLAIVYHKNKMLKAPVFRNGNIGDRVDLFGYSFISAMPVKSEGTNLTNTLFKSEWNKNNCVVVASDAGTVKGMSGGAVYNNSDGTVAGVIIGYADRIKDGKSGKVKYKNVSIYIPYASFKEWLNTEVQR
ncbi:hypothetical protein NG99_05880 [Erwinia typographi]|uniref:Serine protease n=1 Tax=Erwinia typographi TaxID=371042 RepID=A0A0A3Z7V3_9GAMM|nr:trypsin-like peptidase domain-containing protein [Erwinia typographi]KGT95152.1 hypothetical protein NG99_05880 [Erwinia typographi]